MDKRVSWGSMIKGRPVALKSINDSKEMSAEYINELKIHYRCISAIPPLDGEVRYDHGFLRFFGITQNPETKDYIMITELAPYKDIRNLLRQNFTDLSWSDKLYWLRNIAGNLVTIHNADYTHRNLHPGNILMGQIKDDLTVAKLAHLGLSRPAKKLSPMSFKEFYGVLPYVAPEIILGRKYTKASDIYSIGIIMAEISTSIPPFVNRAHDNKLALDICNGLRPTFAEGTPKSYIEFSGQCTNSNPAERPTAEKLLDMFDHWWKITQDPEILDDTFNAADKMIPSIDTSFTPHPDAWYKSRLLNFEGVFDES
ncbi:kinase-like domain-containing protein [Gigaspora rosea]|uniref:Kinase-like domain-containing protein n=1 Tax=Gigaspora rosea TaxID=44941 RepID=A0A397VWE2_9GLOM|nr:kinase-like domain-containing protein [Gigaspora rosea]